MRFIPVPILQNKNEILNSSSFTTPASHTPPNLLASSGTLSIEAKFTVPVFRVKALIGISGGADEMEIYDALGNSLGSAIGDDFDVELTSTTPIARVEIRAFASTTPAIDNFEFTVSNLSLGTPYCTPAVVNSTGVIGGVATSNFTHALAITY